MDDSATPLYDIVGGELDDAWLSNTSAQPARFNPFARSPFPVSEYSRENAWVARALRVPCACLARAHVFAWFSTALS